MANVTFDAVGPNSSGAGGPTIASPETWSHTAAVGAALLVGFTIDQAASNPVTAITYGGTAMTLIAAVNVNAGSNGFVLLYGLANAGNGSAQTVSVTFTGTPDIGFLGSCSYANAALTFAAAFGTPVTATGSTGAEAVTLTGTQASSRLVAMDGTGGVPSTPFTWTNGTNRWSNAGSSAGNVGSGGMADTAGGGSVTMTMTGDSTDSFGIIGVEVFAAASSTAWVAAMYVPPGLFSPAALIEHRQPYAPPVLPLTAAVPMPVIIQVPLLTPLLSPAPPPQVINAPLQANPPDVAAATDSISIVQNNSLPVVITAPVLTPLSSPAAPPQVITAPLQANIADVAAAADALAVTQNNSLPVVVQAPVLAPLLSPAQAPQVITGTSLITQISEPDVGAATDALTVVQNNSLPIVVLAPVLTPLGPFRPPQPQVISAPLQANPPDTAGAIDALSVAQTNSLPVVILAPVLTPFLSPAGQPQVVTAPLQANPADVGAAADALAVAQNNSLPVVVRAPILVPFISPAGIPAVITGTSPPGLPTVADVAAAADAVSIAQTNSLPVVILPPNLVPLGPFIPQQPQVITAPLLVSFADVGAALDAVTLAVSVPLADVAAAVDAWLPTSETILYSDVGAALDTVAISVSGLGPEVIWFAHEWPPTWTAKSQAPEWIPAAEPGTWAARTVTATWQASSVAPTWKVAMVNFAPIAAVSLEYVNVNWTAECAGLMIDPTGQTAGQPQLPVQFAFPVSSGNLLRPAEPVTWFNAVWLLNTTSVGFIAQCLAGPGGTITTLTAGTTYDVWSKVTSSPEIPVKFVGQLPVY